MNWDKTAKLNLGDESKDFESILNCRHIIILISQKSNLDCF
jgi:hypothetical protein